MHAVLTAIRTKLETVIAQIRTSVPSDEPIGLAHNNWGIPGLTRAELVEEPQSIITLIDEFGSDDVDGNTESRLKDYPRRLDHLRTATIQQFWTPAHGGQAIAVYMLTLGGLRKALQPALTRDEQAEQAEALTSLRKAATRVRAMEARLRNLEPRTTTIDAMVTRIEGAFNAADRLPTDLETLDEARQKIKDLVGETSEDRAKAREKIEALVQEITKDHGEARAARTQIDEYAKRLEEKAVEAEAVLQKCETAYSAATSLGLARAFHERSRALNYSMWTWVGGLVVALAAGGYFGGQRLHVLSDLLGTRNSTVVGTPVIVLNLLLSLISVAAPVWFAWLATKQIGQRFRLAEDYAYKASIARAYEGFRRETARFDKEMESRLLVSALDRLDELPLRLVETESHGSPWHELASSSVVKQAINLVPGFTDNVKELATNAISALRSLKEKPTVPPAE